MSGYIVFDPQTGRVARAGYCPREVVAAQAFLPEEAAIAVGAECLAGGVPDLAACIGYLGIEAATIEDLLVMAGATTS